MTKKLLILFPILGMIAFISMGTSNGRAAGANQGNTGAPGDNTRTCISCHNNSNIKVDVKMRLLDDAGQEVELYKPGQTYTVQVLIDSLDGPAARGFGFQMVCLNAPLDENGDDIANWIDSGSNNYKIADARDRSYAEHSGVSGSNVFNVQWQAPEASTGTVSFYSSGNGVNLNGRTSGDGADVAKIEIKEDVSSSTQDQWKEDIQVSPNPTNGLSNITFPSSFNGSVHLYNMIGQKVQTIDIFDQAANVDLTGSNEGVYLLQFDHSDGSSKTIRLLKH